MMNTTNSHDIVSNTDIHDHLKLVTDEIRRVETFFIENGYTIRWDGINTSHGIQGDDRRAGFTTYLRYRTYLSTSNDTHQE